MEVYGIGKYKSLENI